MTFSKISIIITAILVIFLISFFGYQLFFKKAAISGTKSNLTKNSLNQKNSCSLPQAENVFQGPPFKNIFIADFGENKVYGISRDNKKNFEYDGASPSLSWEKQFWVAEYVSIAPDGNLIVTDGQGQKVVKIDRATKKILWEYGHREKPGNAPSYLHAPDLAFQTKEGGILINDGNNRRVIIVDPKTNQIVWQYGHNMAMGSKPGYLMGNTFAAEMPDKNIFITDTIQKKFFIISRATKEIVWQWQKSDLKWPQHVSFTPQGNFVFTDRQTGNLYEINRNGDIVWQFISDKKNPLYFSYPVDIFKLKNNNYLVADAGQKRIIELNPSDNKIVWELGNGKPLKEDVFGFLSNIAIEE